MNHAQLKDHVEFLSGFAFKSTLFNERFEGLPVIRIRDVVRGYSSTYYSGDFDDRYLVKKGDHLIGMDGEFNLGQWRSSESLLNQRVCKISSISPELDIRFLTRFLSIALKKIEDKTPYVTVKHLSIKQLNDIEIPLPPLPEQKRIAAILDAADTLRFKRRETIAQLDKLIQSTFLEIFGDPASNPKRWPIKPLQELLAEKSINGAYYPKEDYSDSGTQMVHMSDVFHGVVKVGGLKRVSASESDIDKYRLLSSDLLISRRSLNYEGAAKPCRIPHSAEPIIFESSMIRIRPNINLVLTDYLFHFLSNERARLKYIFPLVTRSTISGINQSNLMKVKIVTPPLKEQSHFVTTAQTIESQKSRLKAHLTQLDTLFASLQARAFNGEL